MRTTKELLQLMLQNKSMFKTGLCAWANEMRMFDITNYDEHKLLIQYIKNNRPKESSIFNIGNSNTCFYWNKGWIIPRILWIKKHIKLNS